jgi:3-methyl-2-oxobutanoate hydroxymethyltransferase
MPEMFKAMKLLHGLGLGKTVAQCIAHCEAVRRGAPGCFVVGDMPLGSYQSSDVQAVDNAIRFLKEADVDAIKLEGGVRIASRIQAITDAGINVIGHIGLTPQSSGQLGGHKAQGRTAETAKLVVEDALAVQAAGAKMLLVEAVPPEVTRTIWQTLTIPVMSIGAGLHCDGQLLIVSDLIGQFQAFTPKFVKKYCQEEANRGRHADHRTGQGRVHCGRETDLCKGCQVHRRRQCQNGSNRY